MNEIDKLSALAELGYEVKSERDAKKISPERIKDYMAEMGYGWEQAYVELLRMLGEDMTEIALYDGLRVECDELKTRIETLQDKLKTAAILLEQYGRALEKIANAELGAIPDAIAADFQVFARDTIEEG